MNIANKNTVVEASKTVSEIQELLAKAGASQMLVEYEDGEPSALAFNINVQGRQLGFRLPCNWQGVLKALRGQVPASKLNHRHAKRVGWRILKDWLRAQLSLIAAGASTIEEVMLPWAIMRTGKTVATEMLTNKPHLLGLPDPAKPG